MNGEKKTNDSDSGNDLTKEPAPPQGQCSCGRSMHNAEHEPGKELKPLPEDYYRTIADYTSGWEYWISPSGEYLYVSPFCKTITGYSARDFMDDPDLYPRIVHPDDRHLLSGHVHESGPITVDDHPPIDFRIISADGELRWVTHTCRPVFDKNGIFAGRRGSNQDITERKTSEMLLNKHLEELNILHGLSMSVATNISLDSVISVTLDKLMQIMNPNLIVLFLLNGEEMQLKGLRTRDIDHFDFSAPLHNRGECICGLTANGTDPIFSEDINLDTRCTRNECRVAGIKSFVSLPLQTKHGVIGVLGIGDVNNEDYSDRSEFLQSLVAIIATGILNAQLHERILAHADELEAMVEERTSELRKFYNTVENSPASIVITDTNMLIQYVNPFFTKLTGYGFTEAVGKTPALLKSGVHDADFYRRMWESIIKTGLWRGEICNRKKDGTLYWEDASISQILNDEGRIISYVAVKEDITEKKRAEQALKESETRYKTVFQASRDGIIIADKTSRRFLYVNAAICRMLGYDEDELKNMGVEHIHPKEALPNIINQFIILSGLESGCSYSIPCLRKDGSIIFADISSSILFIDNRECIAGFFRDVTERKAMEKMREDIELIIRHDLKTPLNGIINYPEMLLEDRTLTLNGEQKEMLGSIKNSGLLILDMVNSSLDLYKMEIGTYVYRPAPIDLEKTLSILVKDIQPQAETRNIKVRISINGTNLEQSPHTGIYAEELLVYSMLSNLLTNAVEASPKGESVTLEANSENGISFIIHNYGSVAPEIRKRFFEKFATYGKRKGTGLGTYSALLMARTMGGTIGMETSEDKGTFVTVSIPANEAVQSN